MFDKIVPSGLRELRLKLFILEIILVKWNCITRCQLTDRQVVNTFADRSVGCRHN